MDNKKRKESLSIEQVERRNPGSVRRKQIKRWFAKLKERKCSWIKRYTLMHFMIMLLHVVVLYELFRVTIPDLTRLDDKRKATHQAYTVAIRIEKLVIATFLLVIAIYFAVAYEMKRRKQSYIETYGAVINPLKQHRLLLVVAFVIIISRIPFVATIATDKVPIWDILIRTILMIVAVILVQVYAVNSLSSSLLLSVVAFVYDLVLFEYCFSFIFYFLSFREADDITEGKLTWYQMLRRKCPQKSIGYVIDCEILREYRQLISLYFVVETVSTAGFGDVFTADMGERTLVIVEIIFFNFFNSLLFSYIYALLSSRKQFKVDMQNKHLIVQDYLRRRFFLDEMGRNLQLNYYLLSESRADDIVEAFVPTELGQGYKALCGRAYREPFHVSLLPPVKLVEERGYMESSGTVLYLLLVGVIFFVTLFNALIVRIAQADITVPLNQEYYIVVSGLCLGFGDITAVTPQAMRIAIAIMTIGNLSITWATLQLSSLKLNEDSLLISYNEKIMQVKNAMADLSEDIRREKLILKKREREGYDRVQIDLRAGGRGPRGKGSNRGHDFMLDGQDVEDTSDLLDTQETDEERFNRIMGFFRLRWLLNQDLNINPGHICEFMPSALFYDCNTDITSMIRSIKYLQFMTNEQVVNLIRQAEIAVFTPGEVVIKEGSFDSSLYLLLHGQVCQQAPISIVWSDELQDNIQVGGEEISVKERRVFGMIGFFTDSRQLETIISKTTTEMAKISRENVSAILDHAKYLWEKAERRKKYFMGVAARRAKREEMERKEKGKTSSEKSSERDVKPFAGEKGDTKTGETAAEVKNKMMQEEGVRADNADENEAKNKFKDDGPFVETTFMDFEDTRQIRKLFEARVNRKMEPIERLAATNLDAESTAQKKRLVPMVLLIIILRIGVVFFSCGRMTFWYKHGLGIGIAIYAVRLFLIIEMLVLKTGRGITFESVKTRKPEVPTYWGDWEFMTAIFLLAVDLRSLVMNEIGMFTCIFILLHLFFNYSKIQAFLDTFMFLRSDNIAQINIVRVLISVCITHYCAACIFYGLACPTMICTWCVIPECWEVRGMDPTGNTPPGDVLIFTDQFYVSKRPPGGMPEGMEFGKTTAKMMRTESGEYMWTENAFWDVNKNDFRVFYDPFPSADSSVAKRMLICLYFVTMVTTTTGYGMMVPKYPIEKLLVQGLCLWGIIFYSIITAQITSYLINIVGSQFEWRQRMYVREQHLQWHKVSKFKINQMKQLYNYIWRMTRGKNIEELVGELNPYERGRLCHRLYANYLKKIVEISKVSAEGMKRISVGVTQIFVAKDTIIFHHWDLLSAVFILKNGQAQVIQTGMPKGPEEDESDMMINKFQLINLFAPLEVKEQVKGGRGKRRTRQEQVREEEEDDFEVVPKHSTLAAYTVKAVKDCQILLVPFSLIQREFEALPAKERDRLLSKKKMSQKQSQMKKQADGNTEDGPPGATHAPTVAMRRKEDDKRSSEESLDLIELLNKEQQLKEEQQKKAKKKEKKKKKKKGKKKKKKEDGESSTYYSEGEGESEEEGDEESDEEDEDEDEDEDEEEDFEADKDDLGEEKRNIMQVIRTHSKNQFWLAILTKIMIFILLIVSPLHVILNGRTLWMMIIVGFCCLYCLAELIFVEPYYQAKSTCLNVLRYTIQSISCVPVEIIQWALEGDRGSSSYKLLQIVVLMFAAVFRVGWLVFRLLKDLDYGLKMFLSKSTFLSLMWTFLNVAVYSHWVSISFVFFTCFTWADECPDNSLIVEQTNYKNYVDQSGEQKNARLSVYDDVLYFIMVTSTTVGYGDMYPCNYVELILIIIIAIGSKIFYSNVMGDMSSLFTFNINSKSSYMNKIMRLKEEMKHLPFGTKITEDDIKAAAEGFQREQLKSLKHAEIGKLVPEKIERYCILGWNFSKGYNLEDLFNDTPLLMNAEEKREMYKSFLAKVVTNHQSLRDTMNAIRDEAATLTVDMPNKMKKKRDKDLTLAIMRQIALQVQEHSLMKGQHFVIRGRPQSAPVGVNISNDDAAKEAGRKRGTRQGARRYEIDEPNIYTMAKKGEFSKIMGGTKKGGRRGAKKSTGAEADMDGEDQKNQEKVKNKTWKIDIPSGEILTPGDYVVATTCLALVLVHKEVEKVLEVYLKLVKELTES